MIFFSENGTIMRVLVMCGHFMIRSIFSLDTYHEVLLEDKRDSVCVCVCGDVHFWRKLFKTIIPWAEYLEHI